jgi:hypothetical protein
MGTNYYWRDRQTDQAGCPPRHTEPFDVDVALVACLMCAGTSPDAHDLEAARRTLAALAEAGLVVSRQEVAVLVAARLWGAHLTGTRQRISNGSRVTASSERFHR